MQRILLLLLVFVKLAPGVNAQPDTLRYFVDYDNKKCPAHLGYYYRIAVKEDSLWYIEDYYAREGLLQMNGRFYDDSANRPEGIVYWYYKNSKLSAIARFKNGLEEGLHLGYDSMGKVTDSTFFKNGQPASYTYIWHSSGQLGKKGIYDEAGNGSGEEWYYHENGVLADYGKLIAGYKRDGVWSHYYENGNISCREYYDKGKYKRRVCYNADDSTKKAKCKETGSNRAFRRELWKKFVAAEDLLLSCKEEVKGKKGRLIANVCVDINGKITAEIIQSFHPCLDNFIISLFTSGTAQPIYRFNRPVSDCATIPMDLQ